MADANQTDSNAPMMPLFYKQPMPVDITRHKDWKIKNNRNFEYARGTNAVPVVADEFPVLIAHYPIVFSPGDSPAALALVGLRQDENLFIQADGSWKAGVPVPAYVRRYPFILMHDNMDGRDRMVLCVEEDASVIGPDGEFPLFDGDNASQAGNEALSFCGSFNNAAGTTTEFGKALVEQNLLVEQRAELVLPDKRRVMVGGFRIVDEKKFNELPDDVWLEWRKRGYIGLVYAHLMSLARWNALTDMVMTKVEAAA